MKISELVKLLEEYKDKLGDVEVYTLYFNSNSFTGDTILNC